MNSDKYSTTTAAILHQTKIHEDVLPVKNDACRSVFFLHPHPTSKVCLFFHGFTAGPYQFVPLGKALFVAGYNVLIPLQPGHGQAGNWDGSNPPPLPTDIRVYQFFAQEWLQIAQSLGTQVVVGGLSSGGTLAAWLSLEYHAQINRTLLFAPFLSANNSLFDLLLEVLPIYFEWFNKDNPGNFGYDGFRIPALRIFLDLGQEIIRQVERGFPPTFILSSESDRVIDHRDEQTLFDKLLPQQPKSWYQRLDKVFDIPHTMMTVAEGNKYQDMLIAIAKAYIESDITWAELIAVGAQILQGKTFDAAITALNFPQRVSPDVSVLLTIMDKQIIIKGS